MSLWNLFKPSGDTISKSIDSVGNLATNLRSAITGDLPPEKKAELLGKILDVIGEVTKAQSSIIVAEAQSKSWLTRTWRPITALTFLVIIVLKFAGVIHEEIPSQMWTLLTVAMGGYVVGRSAEEVAKTLKK